MAREAKWHRVERGLDDRQILWSLGSQEIRDLDGAAELFETSALLAYKQTTSTRLRCIDVLAYACQYGWESAYRTYAVHVSEFGVPYVRHRSRYRRRTVRGTPYTYQRSRTVR